MFFVRGQKKITSGSVGWRLGWLVGWEGLETCPNGMAGKLPTIFW